MSHPYKNQAGSVYLKNANTFGAYVWGGRYMRLDEITDNLGASKPSFRFDPRGGVEQDQLLTENRGTVDFPVVMKHLQADRMKSDLIKCFWNIDRRMTCGGQDRDKPNDWEEIQRMIWSKANARTSPGSSWESEEENMITIPFNGLASYDIYNGLVLTIIEQTSLAAASLADVDVNARSNCGSICGPTQEPLYVAVTESVAAGAGSILYNKYGGDPSQWAAKSITGFTGGAAKVKLIGNYIIILSDSDEIATLSSIDANPIVYTHSEFTANNPNGVDAADFGFVLFVCDNGLVYASYDGGSNLDELYTESSGNNLNDVKFARQSPDVVYAVGDANAFIRSYSGGVRGWEEVTGPSAGNDLLALNVKNEYALLVIDDQGVIFESVDGGDTWSQQGALEDVPSSPLYAKIVADDSDVFWLAIGNATAGMLYRNVHGGASGMWIPQTETTGTQAPRSIASHGPNNAIGVGGLSAGNTNQIYHIA